MPNNEQTRVGELHIRKKRLQEPECQPESQVEWVVSPKKSRSESLLSNLAIASALVLCTVTLRTGALPTLSSASDALMAAATSDQSLDDDDLLDDQLGRLSFVSALFPEAALVFGRTGDDVLSLPVSGGIVVHTWSAAEPYTSWRSNQQTVTAAAAGEVIGVYHGNGDERLIQVMGHDGLSCLYGNLEEVHVSIGDAVSTGDSLGTLMTGADCVFEVRRNGMSIDPALYMRSR